MIWAKRKQFIPAVGPKSLVEKMRFSSIRYSGFMLGYGKTADVFLVKKKTIINTLK